MVLSNDIKKWLSKSDKHQIIEPSSNYYPKMLKNIVNYPKKIFAKGNIELLNSKACAIVGSRNPQIQSIKNAISISETLAINDITLVSGMALGIDSIVHKSALNVQGKTIAVLPCGIEKIYPQSNQQLYDQIIENNLIISEYDLFESPRKHYFINRNRIVTGLSEATIIIEAKINSGTISSANHAIAQNRDVMTIPIGFNQSFASGNLKLLSEGAICLQSDIDALLQLFPENKQNNFASFSNIVDVWGLSPLLVSKKLNRLLALGLCYHDGYGYQVANLTGK